MTALLEVTDLSKHFGGVEAVGDLDLVVGAGELLGLIGPNGAGKSTVFNLINGVVTPDSGCIKFDGADITGKPPHIVARHGIARAHQIVQPLAGLSVLENCTVGACFGRENLPMAKARETAREVVSTVGLAERMHTLAGSLTTAGKKRLELARALSARPRLLLLDEVLAGLNPTEVEAMIEIVQDIRKVRRCNPDDRARDAGDHAAFRPHRCARSRAQARRRQTGTGCQRSEGHRGLSRRLQVARRGRRSLMMAAPLLKVENLEAGYDDVQVLWGVSLQVQRGGVTTLVGANGAGKTTSLRAITGGIRPRAGRVMFDGEDVTRLPPHAKAARGLVLVPEGRQLFNNMSVEENLEMGAYSARARRHLDAQIERVFTLFPRLKERRRQKAGTFSGGEQQMLAIARGLMSVPTVLMIDELSLGLAPVVVQQLVTALTALRKDGVTLLLVEQNVHLALAISDYAYVIAEGRTFTEGASDKVAAMPEVRKAYLGISSEGPGL